MNDATAHRALLEIHRYFGKTRRGRKCKCGCGTRLTLKSYWEDPTMYKKVPEFLPGHNHKGKRQTPEHVARRAKAIRETLRQKRSKLSEGDKKNPRTKRGRYSPA